LLKIDKQCKKPLYL